MDKKHILVVDDDPAILRLLSTNLKARGYEVTTANNGEESLEAVQRDFTDLIILDIMMPKVDGVEVCRRIREWSDVPIIILSAKGDEKDKVKCLELGADDYLTKPFGIAELMARVKTAFRHRGDSMRNNCSTGNLFRAVGAVCNDARTGRRHLPDFCFSILTPQKYSWETAAVCFSDLSLPRPPLCAPQNHRHL